MDLGAVDAGLLRSRYRITKQRAAVLRALAIGLHLSAEEILERVRSGMPGVSLGTIYRTLDILREIGLVQVFSHAGSAARYEASVDRHYHLLCTGCRELKDVRLPNVGEVARALAEREGFDDVEVALTIVGRCGACSGSLRAVQAST